MREDGMVHLNDKKGHCLFIASLIVIKHDKYRSAWKYIELSSYKLDINE